jgi:plasmid stabilization system protein ParE
MEVYFLKRAIADQLREAEFWREQDPDLPTEFLKELDKAVHAITLAPNGFAWASEPHGLRRYYEKRFHTHILYKYVPEKDRLRIVRIYNARMNPARFIPSI